MLPKTWSHMIRMMGNACPSMLVRPFAVELLRRMNIASEPIRKRPRSPSLQ